jgi:hypothetical protein
MDADVDAADPDQQRKRKGWNAERGPLEREEQCKSESVCGVKTGHRTRVARRKQLPESPDFQRVTRPRPVEERLE